ncbi:ThuA domain-containing protein [Flagellimonas myxillae]|uniref:ThuA domain-containing protein n=1 Tax=Flagellimonas myxillae TaxID=2942214 RepID=UPI00201F9904|nr:ThuA domain-containing protein [Muricauda myxillae]MCL6266799.1 ThuA domain-containing protein [Muricauda myxillae]
MNSYKLLLLALCMALFTNAQENPNSGEAKEVILPDFVLVFSKTSGFRHKSIEKGMQTIREIGRANNFVALQTETSADFNAENLNNFKLVIFLSTTMDVLNDQEQEVFKNYINKGGNFMGIHAATDTEYDWPWYGKMVGAYFENHPRQQKARIEVVDRTHPATVHLNDEWFHFDEWYNFMNLNPDVNVLMKLDESSYDGGTNGDNHPIAWYHTYDGGRVFYTGLGHTEEAFDDSNFKQHLLGGIEWCLGRK